MTHCPFCQKTNIYHKDQSAYGEVWRCPDCGAHWTDMPPQPTPPKRGPCPFCGNANHYELPINEVEDTFWVMCLKCQANGPEKQNENDAVKAWNRKYKKT